MYTTAQPATDAKARSRVLRDLPTWLADELEASARSPAATPPAGNSSSTDSTGPINSGGSPVPIDFQQLQQRLRFRSDAVRNDLRLFPEECVRSLAELKMCVAAGELDQAADVAHRIKGGAGTVSAGPLRLAAAGVEESCRLQRIELVLVRLADLCRETSRTVEHVTAFLKGPIASAAN